MTATCLALGRLVAHGQSGEVTIHIDAAKTYQTISNFAASDAWACQFVGNWPDAKREKIADLLFSRKTNPDGSPMGIGLSQWRFNIGAGSTQQGNASGIGDEWRRAESFLDNDGTYNWQNQAGQVWFLKAAKQRGVKQFLGFSNSPPVQFTANGKSFATKGKVNIVPDKYDAFAAYLANTVKGLKKVAGVKLDYISPVNEPQWDWSDGGQEGCPYNNAEIAGLVRAIDKNFQSNKVSSKILIGEAGSINYLFTKGDKHGKGNQVNDFFKPGMPSYIGDLPTLSRTIATHSYFTTSPMAASVKARKALADTVAAIKGLELWQSEYCILGDNAGEIDGNHRDLGIDAALYLASVIHTDLTVANASAWQWWTAISPYDYKDGLIYIDKNKTDGNFYTSKMLWAMGNYSRFIAPGAVRIAAMPSSGPLLVSAYKKGNELTLVIVNPAKEPVTTGFDAASAKLSLKLSYLTAQDSELKYGKVTGNNATIPARSIVTFTGTIN
ncbi:glycoside hydrolase [Mucilaginibacter psychrotolerans]|uniref:glycoside hydrolase n=1 Tax=Mucilaginibacter psychrotolerans TaxID=1524096 RepID=UPI00195CCA94|nr:glycoside hydrolase [Mucilaginibacter psychrotolerans]